MYSERGHGDRPYQAALVPVLLGDAGKEPSDADAVGAHDDGPFGAVLGQVTGPECTRIPRAQLEDVAHLYPPLVRRADPHTTHPWPSATAVESAT